MIRTRQNWIGHDPDTPVGAEFLPPPARDVERLLDDPCRYANRADMPAVVQAAVVHAQFETIHPFADGNGRVGRALIARRSRGAGRRGPSSPRSASCSPDRAMPTLTR